MEYERIRAQEFTRMQQIAFNRFSAMVGKRPTYKSVAETLPNPHTISVLEWAAALVLLVLTIFTSYKVGAAAVPFAQDIMKQLTSHQVIDINMQNSFIFVTAVLFMLMATPALIYFKLLDHDERTQAEKKRTRALKWYSYFQLDYLTPRIPALAVYGIIVWLVAISSLGLVTNTPDNLYFIARIFEVYLPVAIEVGLASLVSDIIEKRTNFSRLVYANMKETNDYIDAQLAGYESDKRYLKLLYLIMRESFLLLERGNGRQKVKPNLELEKHPELDSIIYSEYGRLTSGDSFADQVLLPAATVTSQSAKRVPPNGDKEWTVDTLIFDLKQRGVRAGYNEKQLEQDYEAGYNARRAWRSGAKNY